MINEYHQNIVERFKKIYNEVRANDLRLKAKYQILINQQQKEHQYKIGDLVWLYAKMRKPGRNPKLMIRWHGPFRIIRFISKDSVILKSLENKILKNPIHVSRIKKFKSMTTKRNTQV